MLGGAQKLSSKANDYEHIKIDNNNDLKRYRKFMSKPYPVLKKNEYYVCTIYQNKQLSAHAIINYHSRTDQLLASLGVSKAIPTLEIREFDWWEPYGIWAFRFWLVSICGFYPDEPYIALTAKLLVKKHNLNNCYNVFDTFYTHEINKKGLIIKSYSIKSDRIILVDGYPGSGKSTVCRQLNADRYKCVDTDDLYQKNISAILKSKAFISTFRIPSMLIDAYRRLCLIENNLIKNILTEIIASQNKTLFIVGSNVLIHAFRTPKFYINTTPEIIYRQTAARTVDEVCANADKLKKIIKTSNPYLMSYDVSNLHIHFHCPIKYITFLAELDDYTRILTFHNYKPISPNDILKTITSAIHN